MRLFKVNCDWDAENVRRAQEHQRVLNVWRREYGHTKDPDGIFAVPPPRAPEPLGGTSVLDEVCLRVTHGDEGPGVYLRDCMIPVEPVLANFFKEDVAYLPLPAARISVDPEKPLCFLRDSRSNIDRINNRNYYGECAVHVCFPAGDHTLHAASFGERLEKGHFGDKVVRDFLPIDDAEGIEILAQSEDKQEFLLRMMPGASFRLHRALKGKQSSVVISWSGRQLKAFSPGFKKTREPRQRNRRKGLTAKMSEGNPALSQLARVVNLASRRQG